MIFYHIQAHDNFDYLKSLIGYVYHPENLYFISINTTAVADSTAALDGLCRHNVSVARNATISWGGLSRVNSLLLGINEFVASPPHLKYFVNISGVDFPFKTQ